MTDKQQVTIRMPKRSLKRWLKALRTGGYEQAKGTLYDPEKQAFCCLGVLQHCLSGGYVETKEDYLGSEGFADVPSENWLQGKGIKFLIGEPKNPLLPLLGTTAASANDDGVSFSEIADAIEACAEGY